MRRHELSNRSTATTTPPPSARHLTSMVSSSNFSCGKARLSLAPVRANDSCDSWQSTMMGASSYPYRCVNVMGRAPRPVTSPPSSTVAAAVAGAAAGTKFTVRAAAAVAPGAAPLATAPAAVAKGSAAAGDAPRATGLRDGGTTPHTSPAPPPAALVGEKYAGWMGMAPVLSGGLPAMVTAKPPPLRGGGGTAPSDPGAPVVREGRVGSEMPRDDGVVPVRDVAVAVAVEIPVPAAVAGAVPVLRVRMATGALVAAVPATGGGENPTGAASPLPGVWGDVRAAGMEVEAVGGGTGIAF